AKYKENVIQRHGPEFDWRAAAPDIEAIYYAGGGLPHGRWGLGDGALVYDRIPRPQRTSQGSSSRRPSRAQQEAQQEETRRLQEETRKLREDNDYMMTHCLRSLAEMFQSFDLHNLIHRCHLTTSAVLSPKDHHLEMLRIGLDPMLQSFDLHNFSHSTPSGQGSPPGDAQGSQPPPNQIIPSGQGSESQQWIYHTQEPPFRDASQSQPPPQWVYPDQPMMMYRERQPMFYPASQPPYYMPWRYTAPPMTPLGSTSRASSQNPDDVDAFLNQSGAGAAGVAAKTQTIQMNKSRADRRELLQQKIKKLLRRPAERHRLLAQVPEIVPDTEYIEKETGLEVEAISSSQENQGWTRKRVPPDTRDLLIVIGTIENHWTAGDLTTTGTGWRNRRGGHPDKQGAEQEQQP
ncbi:hypothetical protein U9M48_040175, partial [Paspalum notatum var. saurae]